LFTFTLATQLLDGKLVYVPDDFSFDTVNRQVPGATSILVNDIQIEISIDHLAIGIWGMCPHTTWQQGSVPKPTSKIGRLWFEGELKPGISIRATRPGKYWPTTFDPSSGWLHVGHDTLADDQAIEFVEGCIVDLRGGKIIGLRLHPARQ
jgi:hypothetical protein